jgi:predicted small metal-binding protein
MENSRKQFACKDVGYNCTWQLEGESEEEMLPIIEKHAAEVHNLTHFKDEAVEHVREAIQKHS